MITYESVGYRTLEAPDEILAKLREYGYDGVEVIGMPERLKEPNRLKELLLSYQIRPILITWSGTPDKDLTSSDETKRGNAEQYLERCTDMAVKLDAPYVQVTLSPVINPDLTESGIKRARKNLVEALREASNYAGDRNVYLLFEPQCRFEGYSGLNSTVEESLGILHEVDVENLRLIVDTFHANIEEVSITRALRKAGGKLLHVHCVDNNRQAPGMGSIDFKPIIRELIEMGYKGYLGLECYPPKIDPNILAEKSIKYLKMVHTMAEFEIGSKS